MNVDGPELLYCSFNQSFDCFAVGTSTGFFVCDTHPVLKERFRREFDDGGIGIVEMLFRCNILALVGGGKRPKWPKNKVMIWDDHQVKCIAELEFRSDVKGVRLRRDRIVVILESKVYVYNFQDLHLLAEISTAPNHHGLCAISPAGQQVVIAVPGTKAGQLHIQKSLSTAENMAPNSLNISACKNHQIGQIAMDSRGALVAVASTKGTVIRVFDISKGQQEQLLSEFRRGSTQATIHSIAFNQDSTRLAVTSDHGTIHIYVIGNSSEQGANRTSVFKNLVPSAFSNDYVNSAWSAVSFDVPETQSICAFVDSLNTLVVLGASGTYYRYAITYDPVSKSFSAKEEQRQRFINIEK